MRSRNSINDSEQREFGLSVFTEYCQNPAKESAKLCCETWDSDTCVQQSHCVAKSPRIACEVRGEEFLK
ncbi:uncharacterized protein Bfra_011694 [Botrytis fragariae]|uniref:Uncharacterized protein n=1 Tax=Botrytis fragariae TaxID=1964551 RepID=A0A8H6AKT2_9HELO|nr:uncharacterized protein Bfra_011694 [Botrytis fragariae]KAF5869151.1 hypothetical protein Bfra_011694 [Botrytis fragariae]